MSNEYVQGTLELTRAFDGWWLPQRPLCCDDDYSQLVRRSRIERSDASTSRRIRQRR